MDNGNAWSQLVCSTDNNTNPVFIKKNTFDIGRGKGCDLSFEGNKLVSSSHCAIERDANDKIWLRDTSTNGTLLNLTKKIHKTRVELRHADEIHLVYKQAENPVNISYIFQDLSVLAQEKDEGSTTEEEDNDTTLEDDNILPVFRRRRTVEGPESDDEITQPEIKRHCSVNLSSNIQHPENVGPSKRNSDSTHDAPPGNRSLLNTQPVSYAHSSSNMQLPPDTQPLVGGTEIIIPGDTQSIQVIIVNTSPQIILSSQETRDGEGAVEHTNINTGILQQDTDTQTAEATAGAYQSRGRGQGRGRGRGRGGCKSEGHGESQEYCGNVRGDQTEGRGRGRGRGRGKALTKSTSACSSSLTEDDVSLRPQRKRKQTKKMIEFLEGEESDSCKKNIARMKSATSSRSNSTDSTHSSLHSVAGSDDEFAAPQKAIKGPRPKLQRMVPSKVISSNQETSGACSNVSAGKQLLNTSVSTTSALPTRKSESVASQKVMASNPVTGQKVITIKSVASQRVTASKPLTSQKIKSDKPVASKSVISTAIESQHSPKSNIIQPISTSNVSAALATLPPVIAPVPTATSMNVSEDDPYEDTLGCTICQEIMHNVVSLQPCMHSFCAGCYSDWMKRSNDCPTCRAKVKRASKNHLVNNLIEAYLKQHPDKKRTAEDLAELDAKTVILTDMDMSSQRGSFDLEENESDDEDDDDDVDSDDDIAVIASVAAWGAPTFMPAGMPFMPTPVPPVTLCRQCPGYRGVIPTPSSLPLSKPSRPAQGPSQGPSVRDVNDNNQPSTSGAQIAGPSLPDVKLMPVPPVHVCPARGAAHMLCQCCLKPMPDQRTQGHGVRRPQQCISCNGIYCHAYWGCDKPGCMGCIGQLRDLNFGQQCLNDIILQNPHESQLFRQYLQSKSLTVRDLLTACCDKLEAKKYKPIARHVTVDSPVCYKCGLREFRELAYQYRAEIAGSDMPAGSRGREDCYWGKNCRTQRGKMHHAIRYNHVCEQTRKT